MPTTIKTQKDLNIMQKQSLPAAKSCLEIVNP